MTTKQNNMIFLLTHNYNVKGKSLGVNEQNHRLYELSIKNSENKYTLHYIVNGERKIVVIEKNDNMTVHDCQKLTMLGNIMVKNGYEFECDKIVEKKGATIIEKRKTTLIDLVGDKIVKKGKTDEEKLNDKIKKLEEKLKVLKLKVVK